MKKEKVAYLLAALGLALAGLGFYLLIGIKSPQGIMRVLPFVIIGLGSGIFGHYMGDVIAKKAIKKHPGLKDQLEIEAEDERNITIKNRAKAKAFDLFIYLFGGLLLAFTLLGVEMMASLMLVAAYLLVILYDLYHQYKYFKEM